MANENWAYGFNRGELRAADRVFNRIKSVKLDQPTEEGTVQGTSSEPYARTEGSMDYGEGTIEFSDEGERMAFLEALGEGYRVVPWTAKWTLKAKSRKTLSYVAYECRVLGNPIDHSQGKDALAGEIKFSFKRHTINGLNPHPKNQ